MSGEALLAHRIEGEGETVLLLNGGLMTFAVWEPVAAALKLRHRVLRCDLRGQLLSPGEPPDDLAGHAADVVRLLDALGIERVHAAGTSFGALVGLILAALQPARVASLVVLTATEALTPEMLEGTALLRAACREALAGGDGGRVFELVAPATFSAEYRAANRSLLETRRMQVASLPSVWFAGLERLLAALEGLDLAPHLPRIGCPTLVVAAERDATFPLSHSESLAAAIPGAGLRVIQGASHGVVVERPEEVARALLEFLSQRPADAAS